MEIHNHGKNLNVHLPNQNAKGNSAVGGAEKGSGVDRSEPVKSQGMLERLEGDVKVRERLLVEIQAKVQAGEYFTRAAAVEAADRIVDE